MGNPLKHLYIESPLKSGAEIPTPQSLAHRLSRVLRLKSGSQVALFNNQDGLFEATITNDKCQSIKLGNQIAPPPNLPSVTLFAALLKKDAFDRTLRQATEMGITTIQPLLTDFTVPTSLNMERATSLIIEATEQCERQNLPQLKDPIKLREALTEGNKVWWCAEHIGGKWGNSPTAPNQGILIGPEGGFSEEEKAWLSAQPHISPVGLGTHILKADTATVAALSRFYEKL